MQKHIYDRHGMTLLRVEEAEPVCGRDFCDECGACLVCHAEDECSFGGEHVWVEYKGEIEEYIDD